MKHIKSQENVGGDVWNHNQFGSFRNLLAKGEPQKMAYTMKFDCSDRVIFKLRLSLIITLHKTRTEKLKFSSQNGIVENANWPICCVTGC